MIRLEWSEALQRKIRRDDASELAKSTWVLVQEAIQGGRTDEALALLEYCYEEDKEQDDNMASIAEIFISKIASFGEEEVEKIWREGGWYAKASKWISALPGVEDSLQRWAEIQRAHNGNFIITEEPDKYVVRCDPCGTGGRLIRTRGVGTLKKAYPWSWSKSGVSIYCTHCCTYFEIFPIELRGYPIAVFLPGDRPDDPCIQLFYKKPELIPEEYFTRVGKTKKIK